MWGATNTIKTFCKRRNVFHDFFKKTPGGSLHFNLKGDCKPPSIINFEFMSYYFCIYWTCILVWTQKTQLLPATWIVGQKTHSVLEKINFEMKKKFWIHRTITNLQKNRLALILCTLSTSYFLSHAKLYNLYLWDLYFRRLSNL